MSALGDERYTSSSIAIDPHRYAERVSFLYPDPESLSIEKQKTKKLDMQGDAFTHTVL